MGYLTLEEVRELGLGVDVASDDAVNAAIDLWSKWLDRVCRQWFDIRGPYTFKLDGNNSNTLFVPAAIVDVEYVRINNSEADLDPSHYRVYKGRGDPTDDRKNPRIKILGPHQFRDIFIEPVTSGRLDFRLGQQNQEVRGRFGYVEPDDSTPVLIERALWLILVEKLTRPEVSGGSGGTDPDPEPSPLVSGIVSEEWTDGHKIKYSVAGGTVGEKRPGLTGTVQNPEVHDIINLYKAGPLIKSPPLQGY